ncbi:hypothetical protein [Celerinatantimonas sp. YJH-8]|uniref:hypothetical protein n=1 Tax=Celerinatantimonas sp. YJH-8 TaxID=3228714 RepID=UPI0038C07C1F
MLTPFLNHLEDISVLDEQEPIIAAGSVCAIIYSGLGPEAPLGCWRSLDISNAYIHLP